jgi:C-terminal processing protease CtpA/Prc
MTRYAVSVIDLELSDRTVRQLYPSADYRNELKEQLDTVRAYCRKCTVTLQTGEDALGLTMDDKTEFGVHVIAEVSVNGPAYRAGLRKGDYVIEVDGTNVCNESRIQCCARFHSAKQHTKLTVFVIEPKGYELCIDRHIIPSSHWFVFDTSSGLSKNHSDAAAKPITVPVANNQKFRRTKSSRYA